MTEKTVYRCDFCGVEFEKENECSNHEKMHVNIKDISDSTLGSNDEYKVYKTIYDYKAKPYFLVENNKIEFHIDGNKYLALCLVDCDDVGDAEEIKIGDKVKVTDSGMLYTTYGEFFIDNELENYLMINYQYANSDIDMDDKYVVEYIGTHRHNGKTLCVIREVGWSENSGRVYLIEINGLRKVD